jgi:long-chain acyl-CoA synthetase
MEAKAKEHNLTSLEKIKAVFISAEPFTVDNNIVTPTMKTKRNVAKTYFKDAIEKMYADAKF